MQDIYIDTGGLSNFKSKLDQGESFNQNVNPLKQYGKQIRQVGQGSRHTKKRFAQPFCFKTNSMILSFMSLGVLVLLYASLKGVAQNTFYTVLVVFLITVLNLIFFTTLAINLTIKKTD